MIIIKMRRGFMRKPVLSICSFVACSVVFANSATVTRLDPVPNIHINTDYTLWSDHIYSINNETSESKTYTICQELSSCTEWPLYVKTRKECFELPIKGHEGHADSKILNLKVNYPITGWCTAKATTSIDGKDVSVSETHFYIS